MWINHEINENVPLILDLTNHLVKFGTNRKTLICFTSEVLNFAILSILEVKMWINHEISENVPLILDLTNDLEKFGRNRNTLIFYLQSTKFGVQKMRLKLLRIAQKLFSSIVKLFYHYIYSFGVIFYFKNQISASPPLPLVENITVSDLLAKTILYNLL